MVGPFGDQPIVTSLAVPWKPLSEPGRVAGAVEDLPAQVGDRLDFVLAYDRRNDHRTLGIVRS
jgi:hypothetical protein